MTLRSLGSLVFALLLSTLVLKGQENADTSRSKYALLWEITGPDLPGPSYVFGSMHVRYSSVFEFPDSLLICLAASDAFANEIHLDSAMQRVFEVYLDQEELDVDSSYLHLIQERILRPDSTALAREDSAERPSFKSFLQSREEGKDLREGENMPTMLDAYLMEVARRLGKKHYGLERIDEHLYEAEDFDNPSASQFKFSWFKNDADELLRLYYEGNLEPIDAFIKSEPESFNKLALIARNYIMVESMERIMAKQRLFSVVGTAHLPGEEGVLELLRQRGYQLRRVTPTFTNLRDSFLLPELERPWPDVKPQRALYQLAMPLGVQHVYNNDVNTSHLSFDIGRGLTYLLLTSSMLPYDYTNFDDVFFVEDGYDVIKKTPYTHGELSGYCYELEMPGNEVQYYRAYTFFYDQQLYYLQVGAYEKETLEVNPDVDTFLERFRLLRRNQKKWVSIVDTVGGFSVRMPDSYLYSSSARNTNYPYRKALDYPQYQYRAGFEDKKASVWMQYYDVTPGTARLRVWDQLQEGVDLLEAQYGLDISVTARDEYQGLPSWELNGEFVDSGLLFKGRVIARGNRLYLLSLVDDSRMSLTKKFYTSLDLLPLSTNTVVEQSTYFDDQVRLTISGKSAEELENLENDLTENARYRQRITGLDTLSGTTYEIEILKLPAQSFINDSLAYRALLLSEMLHESDSLLSEENLTLNDGQPTTVYTYSTEHDQLQQRIQLYHYGPFQLSKRMVGLSENLSNAGTKAFFASDHWNVQTDQATLFSGSANTILTDLSSPDTLTLRRALKSIYPRFTFRTADIPALRNVLLDNHWTDLGLERAAGEKIVAALHELGPAALKMFVDVFPLLQDSDLREELLVELAQQTSTESREAIFQILAQAKLLTDETLTKALSAFRDNPELVLQYWANFSQLLANAQEPLYTWELARQVLAQDSLSKAPILAARHLFLERGKQRLNSWKGQGKGMPEAIFKVYQLLPEAPSILAQVQQMLDRSLVDQVSVEAAAYLLAKDKPLPRKKVRQILKNAKLRVPLIRVLNKYDRLDLVDNRHYDQEAIAQAMLLDKLKTEGVVSNVTMEDSVEALFRGEPRRAYVFSFDLDDDRSRLAVVGFFSQFANERPFIDEELVNYTLYTITRRRQTRKAQQLLEEMNDW